MSRLPALPPDEIPDAAKPLFEFAHNMMGFTPNDAVDMARNPALLQACAQLFGTIYADGTLDAGLKRLIGHIASSAAGCQYCQMHTAHGAHEQGVDTQKIKAVWSYQTSPLFSDAERAALCVAQGGAMTPSAVTDAEFENLRTHYSDDEVVEIIAVISMFGFLNRWNAILRTDIESTPLNFVKKAGVDLR